MVTLITEHLWNPKYPNLHPLLFPTHVPNTCTQTPASVYSSRTPTPLIPNLSNSPPIIIFTLIQFRFHISMSINSHLQTSSAPWLLREQPSKAPTLGCPTVYPTLCWVFCLPFFFYSEQGNVAREEHTLLLTGHTLSSWCESQICLHYCSAVLSSCPDFFVQIFLTFSLPPNPPCPTLHAQHASY